MSITTMSIADGDPGAYETLILGIGNVLWADEGFGIRAIETLHALYTFPDTVRVMDGGTQGIFLLPWVRNAKRLLIFDAIDFGLEPGTLRIIQGDDVPRAETCVEVDDINGLGAALACVCFLFCFVIFKSLFRPRNWP